MFFSLFRSKIKLSSCFPDRMDKHSHILWGVDDGARSLQESLAMIAALKAKKFVGAYCTPHIMTRYPANTPDFLRKRFQELLKALPNKDFDLRLSAEYMLDDNFERKFTAEEPLSHDGKHILVELPQSHFPDNWMDKFLLILDKGYIPVLAHPERYGRIMSFDELCALTSVGIKFQGNVGSLSGFYGKLSRELVRKLHARDLYMWWGTDLHNMNMFKTLSL